MRFLAAFTLVFLSLHVGAAESRTHQPAFRSEFLVSIGASYLAEQQANGRDYSLNHPFSIRGGYAFRLADVYLEYSQSSRSTGTDTVQVETDRFEYLLWAKHAFLRRWPVRPFAAVGAGFGYDMVDTEFMGAGQTHAGRTEPVLAAVGGWQYRFWKIEADFETRLTAAESYTPNPTLSFGLFLGGRF